MPWDGKWPSQSNQSCCWSSHRSKVSACCKPGRRNKTNPLEVAKLANGLTPTKWPIPPTPAAGPHATCKPHSLLMWNSCHQPWSLVPKVHLPKELSIPNLNPKHNEVSWQRHGKQTSGTKKYKHSKFKSGLRRHWAVTVALNLPLCALKC